MNSVPPKKLHSFTDYLQSSPLHSNIDNLTDYITDYINFCVENTVPTRTLQYFPNNKPWINPDTKTLLKEKKRVFKSGNKEELKTVHRELRKKIREGKACYRRKMENQLQQKNVSGVWKKPSPMSVVIRSPALRLRVTRIA